MRVWFRVLLAVLVTVVAVPVCAQSPNTATISVVVVDQTGAVVPDAKVTVVNRATSASRDVMSNDKGVATMPGLQINGKYTVTVSKTGFTTQTLDPMTLTAGETATVKVKLAVSGKKNEVTVYGTTEGVRQDPQLGQRLDSERIDETPVLGRKISSLPLQSAAFRSAKGTGDLFVNATYFVTGAGGRRQPAVTADGATNDDPWGRQTMATTVPVGAVQEMTVLSHAFSAEFGWTAGAAVNLVTKSGTDVLHGDGLFLGRPSGLQASTLSSDAQCAPSISTCVPPQTNGAANALLPPDIPDTLSQVSGDIGGAITPDKTFYFVAFDYANQHRTAAVTTPLVPTGTTVTGNYQQALVDGRVDHRLNPNQNLMLRFNLDRFYDTNPQDVVAGNTLPSAGRQFTRHTWSVQGNHTAIIGDDKFNEARFVFIDADPITQFEPVSNSTQITRGGTLPFTVGENRYAHIYSRQGQFSDTLTWTKGKHYVRLGGNLALAVSGGDGTEFGSPFVLGQFTINAANTKPLTQLTIADVQRYTQGFNFGVGTYRESQWLFAGYAQDRYSLRNDLTLDLGLRYDRQTFSDGQKNVAPRVGFAWNPNSDPKAVVRGGYGLYFTQLRSNLDANFQLNGPLGIGSYTATPGQAGFPTCLPPINPDGTVGGGCTPIVFDPNAAASTLPARNVTIRPGEAAYYTQLFQQFGVNFNQLPFYPDALVNPKSQVLSVGFERELKSKWYASADYIHQHWSDLDQTVDLNAPTPFVRTAPGQVRSVAAADATRPILPVNGGFRQINVIMNLGKADYDGLQTNLTYRGSPKLFAQVSYTLSKATNTTEPDGNGINPNDANISTLLETERGPSVLDQRHRAVLTLSYRFPYAITAGTVTQLGSARPFNAVTGVDNNGDGSNNDRPVINGMVVSKSAFRGTAQADVSVFAEGRIAARKGQTITLRMEVFNLFNHANVLGRQTNYGDTGTPAANFGQALAGLANIDPPRMVQFIARYSF
jgi:carboxypeptidase family protein/TonB-dependent receptor-like protein